MLEAIGAAGINIIASTVSDTAEYGLFRLITSDNEKAFALLKEKGIGVHLTPVIALSLDSKPGSLAAQIKCFSLAGLNIQYLYSVSVGGKAFIILKFDNNEAALKMMEENHFSTFTIQELATL